MFKASALSTDLYQLTMAAGYFHKKMHTKRISMELFVRHCPPERRFFLFAGLQSALDYLRSIRFDESQIDYLRRVPPLRNALNFDFIEFLRDFRFRGDVWAMSEGTVAFAKEPFVRITGTLLEAQLVETALLSIINTETMIASKAARVVIAADSTEVLEFGTRRTSPGEAVTSARAAYIAGFSATSNVEAGYQYNIPLAGTAAHSWTMAHESERDAFQNYSEIFPEHSTVLVDTYDTLEGTRRAIEVIGSDLAGVRLDSGDLLELSQEVRKLLDNAGLANTKIIASGDLNEQKIAHFRQAGAPIDVWGVGTELVRSKDAPSLGAVYKLVEDHETGRPIAKFSIDKATLPGCHQVFRIEKQGRFVRDIIGTTPEFHVNSKPLLEQWMQNGKLTKELPSLSAIRRHARNQIQALPGAIKSLAPMNVSMAPPYEVRLSDALNSLVEEVRQREVG